MLTVRPETRADHEAIRAINEAAFGQPNEANLIDALRSSGRLYASLVAQLDGQLVGHIFFSPITVESGESSFTAMSLAPMAVLPEHQRLGVGLALVCHGLDECRRLGYNVVIVLGHPEYYPRFGFVPAQPLGLICPYNVPDEAFMVAELVSGALAGRRGTVKYPAEFDAV